MNRKLGRKKAHRDHTLRNLATSLVLYERIDTTEAKAKEVKSIVDELLARAKSNDLDARRKLLTYLFDQSAVQKIMTELLPRYSERKSGFVRSFRLGPRVGDNSMVVRLELVDSKVFVETEDKKQEKAKDKEESIDDGTTVEVEEEKSIKSPRGKKNA